jgi:hypothetical protein
MPPESVDPSMPCALRRLAPLPLAFLVALLPATARAAPGDLLFEYLPFSTIAPQDIAYDPAADCFWVTALLDDRIYKYSSDLRRELETIPSPFTTFEFQTGIAYNSLDDTLLVTSATSGRVIELLKDGTPTERVVPIPFDPSVPAGRVTVRSLVFDAQGNGGQGSLYAVESLGTAIYEFTLDGTLIRVLSHPEDPDGFPGEGRHASAAGFEVIRGTAPPGGVGGEILGYYVTGVRRSENRLLRLDADGSYTGVALSLNAAGGSVSSVLRHRFPDPTGGPPLDALICVVESNARFAVLEAGEPEFREIFGLECTASGRSVRAWWSSRQRYDRVEVFDGCEVLAVLPGDATSWEADLDTDGIYALGVRAVRGESASEVGPCVVVIGAGQILRARAVGGAFPVDLASDGSGLLLASDAFDRQLLVFDASLEGEPLGVVPLDPAFVAEDELVSGLSAGPEPGTFFVYNTSRHTLGVTDFTGEVTRVVEVALPNIDEDFDPEDPEDEPDLGVVLGMAFDPGGGGGGGALWLVEGVRDRIYQVDRAGNLLREIPSPYLSVERPPVEDVFATFTSGVSLVPGRPDLLWVTGGTFRDFRQRWIALLDVEAGAIVPGSEITTEALRVESGVGSFAVEAVAGGDGAARLFALALAGERSVLAELAHEAPAAPAPTYLACRLQNHASDVELTFINNGPYDAVEVLRDCEVMAVLAGAATSFVDRDVPPGLHEYAVRGVAGGLPGAGGRPGDAARCSVRVGAGAVLQREISYPARSPQQLARDPVDGSFFVAVNWPGDERKVYHFDRNLQFLDERESVIDPSRQIATIAVRAPPGAERLLVYVSWVQPVPLGEVATQRFFLVSETLAGELFDEVEIFPPRPTNGFITFPTGLSWDAESDTFFYLERNSKTFVRIDPDGGEIDRFPHPSPPFQNFVFNLGLTVSRARRTLFFTTAGEADHEITWVREMDFDGNLTGASIPLSGIGNEVRDIEIVGDESSGGELIAAGTGSFWELLRVKAFPAVPAPFLRGDADDDGALTLTDAVAILAHLFRGGSEPACLDGADADDSGRLSITDAIAVLNRLFRGAAALPAPYPEPGQDPTPDGLGCRQGESPP